MYYLTDTQVNVHSLNRNFELNLLLFPLPAAISLFLLNRKSRIIIDLLLSRSKKLGRKVEEWQRCGDDETTRRRDDETQKCGDTEAQ